MDATGNTEDDEFARLLAQLNGTTEPEPAAATPFTHEPSTPPASAVPPAPAFTMPTAPAAAPVPTFAAATPAAPPAFATPPAPEVPQTPVAPAFGAAAPYPPRVERPAAPAFDASSVAFGAPTFPGLPTPPADVAPVVPPLPRAPELMGADELAAPPRPAAPLFDPAPALVDPPSDSALPAPGTVRPQFEPPQFEPPQTFASGPSTPAAPAPVAPSPFASAPAPSAPALFAPEPSAPAAPFVPTSSDAPGLGAYAPGTPSFSAPAPSAPAPSAPASGGPAPAVPTGVTPPPGRPPLDFASVLATPVGVDDDARAASALRLGSPAADDDDEPDIARPTTAEKIGLALAVLVAPIGLIVGVVAAVRSSQRRGWVIGIIRASIAIAAVLSVVIGIGGYYEYTQFKLQQAHDEIAASSATFCSTIKANPSMAQLPTFGWPAVGASIPDSLKAMQAYEDRWTKLAAASPAGIKPGVTRVAEQAKKIVDAVNVARTVDDAANVAAISAVASSSGVPEWYSEYCR